MIGVGFFDHPAVIGLMIGVPSALLGYFGYRRSKRADTAAEKTGTITQVYTGLDRIIAALQADNADLRTRLSRIEGLEAEVRTLLNRVATLERFIRNQGLANPPKNGNGV